MIININDAVECRVTDLCCQLQVIMHMSENGYQFKFHLYRSTQSWNQNNNIRQISITSGLFLKHEISNPEKNQQPNIAPIYGLIFGCWMFMVIHTLSYN